MRSLLRLPFFDELSGSHNVLVAGAGGGFDVYAGLPLAFALMQTGARVHLANLSFTDLFLGDGQTWLADDVAAVTPDSAGPDDYFPERTLARWLATNELPATVYAFPQTGVQPLRAAYRALVKHVDADAVVLIDGGTDILMRGDESGLGTPEEDMVSLAAVAGLEAPTKLVACIGFGIDAYHGVNHVQVLENIAALERDGAYVGAFTISRSSHEAELYLDAVAHAQQETPIRPSIVNGHIAAAVRGEFGDAQFTKRTSGSPLFVNPLMAMYFTFQLDGLAKRSLYLDRLERTVTIHQVSRIIDDFREEITPRIPKAYPH